MADKRERRQYPCQLKTLPANSPHDVPGEVGGLSDLVSDVVSGSGALQQLEDVSAVGAGGGVVQGGSAVPVRFVHGVGEVLGQVPDHAWGEGHTVGREMVPGIR